MAVHISPEILIAYSSMNWFGEALKNKLNYKFVNRHIVISFVLRLCICCVQ